jgi:hypothetical protein
MAEWADLEQRIEEMNTLVTKVIPVGDENLDGRLRRLRHVGTLVEQVVGEVDREAVREDWFDSLLGQMTNVVSEVQAFVANSNTGHLENAANSWPNIVSALSPLAILVHPPSKNRITREANAFHLTVTQVADEVQARAQGVREELDELKARIDEDQVLRSQAAQAFTDRQAEVDGRVNEAAARLDQAVEENRQTFAAEQTERGEAAQAERDARQQEWEKHIAEQTGAFQTHLDQMTQIRARAETEAGEQKKRLDQLLEQATKVYNTILGLAWVPPPHAASGRRLPTSLLQRFGHRHRLRAACRGVVAAALRPAGQGRAGGRSARPGGLRLPVRRPPSRSSQQPLLVRIDA